MRPAGRAVALAAAAWLLAAPDASALSWGLRPLGADWESARMGAPGELIVEVGAWAPSLLDPGTLGPTEKDMAVFERYRLLPAWPSLRGRYVLQDGNEVLAEVGPLVGGGYRRPFMRADAPWEGEYLQAVLQAGGGFHLPAMLPAVYGRLPLLYERGPVTFHVAPGGYYMLNNQPIVDVGMGVEWRVFAGFSVGGAAKIRMDAKQVTPTAGSWSFGGGARYAWDRFAINLEFQQENGTPAVTKPDPRIEFPMDVLRASVVTVW